MIASDTITIFEARGK